ncbi:uncharacterized protein [Oscarella lobularis]|uniref:uncharacterized protein n=1 Tax=Oscarella lobularis TaxID=121494 RepID=UPI0033137E1B
MAQIEASRKAFDVLKALLSTELPDRTEFDMNVVDDCALSYISSYIETIEHGHADSEMEELRDLLGAYVPQLANLPLNILHKWVAVQKDIPSSKDNLAKNSNETLSENLVAIHLSQKTTENCTSKRRDDAVAKDFVLSRYAFVDTADENKTFVPRVKLDDIKEKSIRYREGKIVSTKGEKYQIELKRPESEDMKKTYVSLKPARKYRFH